MIPSRSLLFLTASLALLALLAAFVPALSLLWPPLAGLATGAAVLDAYLGRRLPALDLQREVRHSIPVGVWSPVILHLGNPGRRRLQIRVHDHHPAGFAVDDMPTALTLSPHRGAHIHYRIRPQARGDAAFEGTDLVIGSPLGFWRKKHFLARPDRVKVFPNFRDISHYVLLATDNRLSQIGIRQCQRRGEGNDFHQLREYRAGDSLRQIDWKASSRYQKLISKEYQDERDQQVIFLLDCGHRMRHAEDGRMHLDQALNAMLLLAFVAARQGDAVGFMAFGGTRRWYPPRKGGGLVKELLHQIYDIESRPEAADYLTAARELMPLQGRRALLVMLTNTRDEDQSDLRQAVKLLTRRHLVVIADLREALLDEALGQPVGDFDGALRFQAVNDYLESRSRSHESLRHHGVLTLDILASQLPVALVNQYLSIKAGGAL